MENPALAFRPFLLLGLLANYDKFEHRNPYRVRLEDFVNETGIIKIVQSIGIACSHSRNHYVAVQDDATEGWTLANTLAYISFGVLSSSKGVKPHPPQGDDLKEGFMTLYLSL